MAKRILALVLCLCMVFLFAACGGDKKKEEVSSTESVAKPEVVINPLTGADIAEDVRNNKITAVVIENSTTVQKVQTGLNKFDIVYEYPVEGGITRLLAVTKDVNAIGDIGNIRSAREVALELACGHGANLVHAGFDHYHFKSLRDYTLGIKTYDLLNSSSEYSERRSNGHSSEHTLYTKGEWVAKLLEKNSEAENETWISFNKEDKTPSSACKKLYVPISGSHVANFSYNETTGKYTKLLKDGSQWKDYFTKETAEFTNVFVLFTETRPHNCTGDDIKHHVKVELNSGSGYYVTKGGVEEISWTKGGANSPFSFKKADGSEFSANAGNSYICIADNDVDITIE